MITLNNEIIRILRYLLEILEEFYLWINKKEECLNLLRGQFAFSIWDNKKKVLFIARDRLGQKPLIYYYNDNELIFSSEINSSTICKKLDL